MGYLLVTIWFYPFLLLTFGAIDRQVAAMDTPEASSGGRGFMAENGGGRGGREGKNNGNKNWEGNGSAGRDEREEEEEWDGSAGRDEREEEEEEEWDGSAGRDEREEEEWDGSAGRDEEKRKGNNASSDASSSSSFENIELEKLEQNSHQIPEMSNEFLGVLLNRLNQLKGWECDKVGEEGLPENDRKRCAIWEQWSQLLRAFLIYERYWRKDKLTAEEEYSEEDKELTHFALAPMFKYGGKVQSLDSVVTRIEFAYRARIAIRHIKIPVYSVPNIENCKRVALWARTLRESGGILREAILKAIHPKQKERNIITKRELRAVKAYIEKSGDVYCEHFEVPTWYMGPVEWGMEEAKALSHIKERFGEKLRI